MPLAYVLLAFLGLSLAGVVQEPAPAAPAAGSVRTPITVQLQTACDFPDVLGGQRIRMPTVEIERVLGPRVVVVWRPSIIEIDRTSRESFTYDHLIVLLPPAPQLARKQVITVIGEVRTMEAAQAAGVRVDEEVKDKKALKSMPWPTRRLVLVADSVETEDGLLLAGVR
jgi:hypothetical protein